MRYTVIADSTSGFNDAIGKYWRKSTAIEAAVQAKTYGYPGALFYRRAENIRTIYVRDRKGNTVYVTKEDAE